MDVISASYVSKGYAEVYMESTSDVSATAGRPSWEVKGSGRF